MAQLFTIWAQAILGHDPNIYGFELVEYMVSYVFRSYISGNIIHGLCKEENVLLSANN
jgi:hypothetical protein